MKKSILVIAFALLSVCSARAEDWSVVAGGSIGKVGAVQIEGKTYADVQALLSFLGYTISINTEGKVIAVEGGAVKEVAVANQPKPEVVFDQFDAALQSLKDIASVVRDGMDQKEFSRLVSDSKISIDRLADKLGAENPNVKSLQAVLAIYLDTDKMWQKFNEARQSPLDNDKYLVKNDPVLKEMLKKYTDLSDKLEKKFLTKRLSLKKGLNFFWDLGKAKTAEIKKGTDTPVIPAAAAPAPATPEAAAAASAAANTAPK